MVYLSKGDLIMKEVSGTLFFNNGKVLLVKPRRRPTLQVVGGSVEEGETVLEAAIRECHEELGAKAIFNHDNIKFLIDFEEKATSDPNLKIHMNLFIYNGKLDGELTTSEEIEYFMWYGITDDKTLLSNALRNVIIPYCIDNKLVY